MFGSQESVCERVKPQDSSFILGLTLDICWTTYKTIHGTKDKKTFTRYDNWDNTVADPGFPR